MRPSLAIAGGVLIAGALLWFAPLLPDRPLEFLLHTLLFLACVGVFFGGGVLDGRGPAASFEPRAKRLPAGLRVLRLLVATCGGFVVTGLVAMVLTPPDPFSLLVCCMALSVACGVFYGIGLRQSRTHLPGNGRTSFTRPFECLLVLLTAMNGLLVAIFPSDGSTVWRIVGFLFFMSAVVVLLAFRRRWAKSPQATVP